MKTAMQIRMATAAMVAVLAAQAMQAADQQTAQPSSPSTPAPAAPVKREIVVSLEDRKLALVEDGQVVKVYPVAVGKPSTPSPEGTFAIERRVANPTYHHDGKTVPPGPNNPVGTRWMGLSIKGYGIHGTNEPKSIGKAASHGCIRMAKADLEELYPLVQVGDVVELVGHRDEETARLFGDGSTPAAAANAEMAAKSAAPAVTTTADNAAAAAGRQAPATRNGAEVATAAILTGAL
jgi:lipoprotein-anchoring transpeptidase ErfK/SrfK